jgi:hypothetical protein
MPLCVSFRWTVALNIKFNMDEFLTPLKKLPRFCDAIRDQMETIESSCEDYARIKNKNII